MGRSDDHRVITKARRFAIGALAMMALGCAWLALPSSGEAQQAAAGALGAPAEEQQAPVGTVPADAVPAAVVAQDAAPTEAVAEEAAPDEAEVPGSDALPEPDEVAEPSPSRQLDAPMPPSLAPRDIAMQLANLELEELALQRESDSIGSDRTLSIALYVGGIGLTIASVAMLVAAVLQGACVSEEFGCYDAPQYIIGGVPVALIGALILSGASTINSRVGIRERALRPRREAVEEQRRTLERRVGLAIGPGSLRLSVAF